MEQKLVRIECTGHDSAPLEAFVEMQGDLKSLSEEAFQALRQEIITDGFSFPVHVWKDGGKLYLLDGHQRTKTLRKMQAEGWQVPPIPYSVTEAGSFQHAKHKLLAAASQYGKLERDGLASFLDGSGITADDIQLHFQLPEVNLGSIFGTPSKTVSFEAKQGATEIGEAEFMHFAHTCPRCNFGFN